VNEPGELSEESRILAGLQESADVLRAVDRPDLAEVQERVLSVMQGLLQELTVMELAVDLADSMRLVPVCRCQSGKGV